ncbi:MAG: hypothetical protein IV100_24025 [Myxococcales bacterium]|nr:hypothetical protein [Myxococcales bacterium]
MTLLSSSLANLAACSKSEVAATDTVQGAEDNGRPEHDSSTEQDTEETLDVQPTPEDASGEDVALDASVEETSAAEEIAVHEDLPEPEDVPEPVDLPEPEDVVPPEDVVSPDDVPPPDDVPAVEDAGPSCVTFTEEVAPASAALLIVLDASASMSKGGKWASAQLAITQAIDEPAFDGMTLGLLAFPAGFVDPPQCICDNLQVDYPTCKSMIGGVSCGAPLAPQVAFGVAGPEKSSAGSGIRKTIVDWLVGNGPLSNLDDGSPVYDALRAGYAALGTANVDRRVLVLITDGGFSCTSMATPPRDGYADLYGCLDWEKPDLVIDLIAGSQTDSDSSVETFVVGVPGSNSTGQKIDNFDTPPYPMSLALSNYAVAGSPKHLPPGCSSDAVFNLNTPEPTAPCHIDLSSGAGFNSVALAESILNIRRQALGCIYELPASPDGGTIEPGLVNVTVTVDGAQSSLLKRASIADACMEVGCWDYTPAGQVELIGKACDDVSAAAAAKVAIAVGCETQSSP